MKRRLYEKLCSWKVSQNRKPLLLQGARQVGKTYLVNHFAKQEYQNYVYLNFEQNPDLKNIFGQGLNPHTIIQNIGLYFGKKINAADTLIFLMKYKSFLKPSQV